MKKFNIYDVLPPKQKHLATVFRCYPRTLKEAFPQDQDTIYPFTYLMRWNPEHVISAVLIVAVVVLILDLFLWRP